MGNVIKYGAHNLQLCFFIHQIKNNKMKRLLLMLMFSLSIGIAAHAQDKDKVKQTSTVPQKVHNTFSKHKKHKGYKTKHRHHGVTAKKKVDRKEGEAKEKVKK